MSVPMACFRKSLSVRRPHLQLLRRTFRQPGQLDVRVALPDPRKAGAYPCAIGIGVALLAISAALIRDACQGCAVVGGGVAKESRAAVSVIGEHSQKNDPIASWVPRILRER